MNTEKVKSDNNKLPILGVSGSFLKFTNGLIIEGMKNIDVKFIDGEVNIKSDKGINLTMDYKRWVELQK